MNRRHRAPRGSIMLLTVAVICFIILPTLITVSQLALYYIDRSRAQTSVEAACLVAANNLSRVIVDDPHFGYVSLSNYPPIGKATCADDGEPLPVTGVNTLMGTVRQNTIIADELGSTYINRYVSQDRDKLDDTVKLLNKALAASLKPAERGSTMEDLHGNKIESVKQVKEMIEAGLPPGLTLKSVEMETGWLEGAVDSCQSLPSPRHLARVHPEQVHNDKYRPFINIPAAGRSFTFAAVSNNSCQVDPKNFRPADKEHICSIVRLKCVIALNNMASSVITSFLGESPLIECVACAQPFCLAETGPKGAMTLRFTAGPVPGLSSWREFLTPGNFQNSEITRYNVEGGDYPSDSEARMVEQAKDATISTEQIFAENLYYWLRNGHTKPKIDAVLEMVNEQFKVNANEIFTYEFARDGSISRRILDKDPFPKGVTSHAQAQCMVSTQVHTGVTPVIIFRNDVANLGLKDGGKHAGQPLAGYPLNWAEISEYGGDEQVAKELGKGRLGTNLTLFDPYSDSDAGETEKGYGLFRSIDGKEIDLQPRKSYYSGGLALDIEIGGFKPSTAQMDVDKMKMITGNREI
ncbi:MAG: hypothetical protein LCH63_17195 [Candidatus Melainabacteria bacterium]|nr:hypothetical protein [Candidatus Melainabacteria bacterium]